MKKVAIAGGAVIFLPLFLGFVLIAGVAVKRAEAAKPSDFAVADIPADYLSLYQAAAGRCPGLSWAVLAAVGKIESDHGRSTEPGVASGSNSAGAMGPMQFLAPTWAAHGVDGNGDGQANPYDPADAIPAAVDYLCSLGAADPARLRDAVRSYNGSGPAAEAYADQVLELAERYSSSALTPVSGDAQSVLANPNITLSDAARNDIASGQADQRVIGALAAIGANHRISVSVIKTGHSQFVHGTNRVSNHYYGRAVDIYAVDGADVSPSNDAAKAVAESLLLASPPLRPDELGSPWPDLERFQGAFSDGDHQDHLHLGWSG